MALRSPRSDRFAERQAAQAKKRRDAVEARAVPKMAANVSAYFEGFAERFAATLWDFGTPGAPSPVDWPEDVPESKDLAEDLLGSGWANKHLDPALVAEAQLELERLLNKYPEAGFSSMSVIVDQRFGAETDALGNIKIHSSSLTPTGQKAIAAKNKTIFAKNGIPMHVNPTPAGLVRHEFGHVISQNGAVLQAWHQKNYKALNTGLSVYGESTVKEAWAEAFAAFEGGDERFGVREFLIERGFDPDRMNWPAEQRKLFDVLKKDYIQIGNTAFADVGAMTGRSVVGFGLDSRGSFGTIGKVLGNQVKGITEATRASLSDMIQTGIHNGDHPSVIAKNLMASARGWAGLEDLTKSRAYTIARTETAHAYTWSSIAAYTKSGIVDKVICHDAPDCGWIGHNGSELANGTHRTLMEAGQHPTSHPNCVRAFSPAFGDEEPGIRQRAQPQAPAQAPARAGAPKAPAQDARLDPKHWANPKDFNADPNRPRYGQGLSPLEDWGHGMFTKRFAKGNPPPLGPEVLSSYQGSGYRDMNPLLRGEIKPNGYGGGASNAQYIAETQAKVDTLRAYINTMETPEAVVVHRGTGSGSQFGLRGLYAQDKEAAARALVGTTHTEQGFMSTALDSNAKFSGVTLELTVPKGYPAIPVSVEAGAPASYLSTYSATQQISMGEAELLLQDGAEYVIDEVIVTPYNAYAGGSDIILKGRVLPRK